MTTEDEREAAFQRYLELSAPYFAVVEDKGHQPWFNNIEERRELFMRRYRPCRPANAEHQTLNEIRRQAA